MDQAKRGGAGGGSRREGFKSHSKAPSKAGFSKTSKEPSKAAPSASAAADGAKDAEGGDDASKLGGDPDASSGETTASKAKEEPKEEPKEEEEEAAWITYDAEGFRKVLDVDLAIAEVCGSDFMLPEDHPEFKRNAECCAKVALEQGYERWPGCGAERGCATVKHSGSSDVSPGLRLERLRRLERPRHRHSAAPRGVSGLAGRPRCTSRTRALEKANSRFPPFAPGCT